MGAPVLKPDAVLGMGIYTPAEVAHLAGVSVSSVRRWSLGYRSSGATGPGKRSGESGPDERLARDRQSVVRHYVYPPIYRRSYGSDGPVRLSFLDLAQIRALSSLVDSGMRMQELRTIVRNLEAEYGSHPLVRGRFYRVGGEIVAEEDGVLVEMRHRQTLIRQVVEPMLVDLEYGDDGEFPSRWWPLGRHDRRVVVDPDRRFGQPLLHGSGMPTWIVAEACREQSVSEVADWYELDADQVAAAVHFERQRAA